MATKKSADEPVKSQNFISRHRLLLSYAAIGFLGGVLWLVAMRLLLVSPPPITHHHANFAVYIDGVREEFKEFTYYEEVTACSADHANHPNGRVHMHNQVNDVIHVHDKAVTYGHFFQALGWSVGDDFLATRDNVLVEGGSKKLVFILNGKEVDDIASQVVNSTDRLLVSFGETNTDFNQQFESVAETAAEVNKLPDPAACGGDQNLSFIDRLKTATFWY